MGLYSIIFMVAYFKIFCLFFKKKKNSPFDGFDLQSESFFLYSFLEIYFGINVLFRTGFEF